MMIPNPMPCSFEPESTPACPRDPVQRALWACIKWGHCVDQHFDSAVAEVAAAIEAKAPRDYWSFRDLIGRTVFSVYGKRTVKRGMLYTARAPDDTFWRQVWEYVSGAEVLRLVYRPGRETGPRALGR